MKIPGAMAALLLMAWFVLKTVLPAFRALFRLLADVLPFLLTAAVACALAVVVVKRTAELIRRRKRRRMLSAYVDRPATIETPREADPAASVARPVDLYGLRSSAACRPGPDPWIPLAPKESDAKADSDQAGGTFPDSAHSPGLASRPSQPTRYQEPAPGRSDRSRGRSATARGNRHTMSPESKAATGAASPPASATQPMIHGLEPAEPDPVGQAVAVTSPGRARRRPAASGPGQVIVIERCDGGQVGQGNEQYNVYRVSLPDVTLISNDEVADKLLNPDAAWLQDAFSHDARPSVGNSGHLGSSGSSQGMIAGPRGDTLVIVRNSRGIQVGNYGSQRNEFRIRVTAVKIRAVGLAADSARNRDIAKLREDPGNWAAAGRIADAVARAAASELELKVEAMVTRQVEDSRIDGWPSHADHKKGFQIGANNKQRFTIKMVNVQRPRIEQLRRALRRAAEQRADRDIRALRSSRRSSPVDQRPSTTPRPSLVQAPPTAQAPATAQSPINSPTSGSWLTTGANVSRATR